ncbi:carboxypeptidase-like regulatory domain-containing protein [Paraflavitalea speifideaquila]|uniref:carboxypeptidase-like regulatory domain-containing protein n=1 Tax=Paraflavitalea speifideaquila TaxID=3076558 RepID=UPI0028E3BA3C|nr:carboxypeptidase-like regulatory domain-containing protein [Paraflavitalea speifideiaquila]
MCRAVGRQPLNNFNHINAWQVPQEAPLYTGKVSDKQHKGLAGVTVKVTASGLNTSTDSEGRFSIRANEGDELVLSAPGFYPQSFTLTEAKTLVFTLEEEPVIVVSNKKQVDLIYTRAPQNLTAAATGVLYNETIVKMPVTSLRNTLTGRLAGVYTYQTSGAPGNDGVFLSLRGISPIVMIDGIPATSPFSTSKRSSRLRY